MVAACSREWGVTPGKDEKTVWAQLPVGDSTNYSRAIRKAAHDAVRAALAHGRNPVAAETAVRQIAARLTDQHGARALGDMIEQLAHDLAEVTATIPSVSGRDGQNVADNGSTATREPTSTDLSWWDQRFNRTLLTEFAYARPWTSNHQRRAALPGSSTTTLDAPTPPLAAEPDHPTRCVTVNNVPGQYT